MSLYLGVLVAGLVASIGGLVLGRVLRQRAPRISHVLHFSAAALARVLAAVVLVVAAIALFEDPTLVRVGLGVLLVVLALFSGASAALMTYVAVAGRTDAPGRWPRRTQQDRKGL